MSRKTMKSTRVAPLQHVIAEEITDPAEMARLDRLRKKRKKNTTPWSMASLQHVIAEEIIDPAERARLEKAHQGKKKRPAHR